MKNAKVIIAEEREPQYRCPADCPYLNSRDKYCREFCAYDAQTIQQITKRKVR